MEEKRKTIRMIGIRRKGEKRFTIVSDINFDRTQEMEIVPINYHDLKEKLPEGDLFN